MFTFQFLDEVYNSAIQTHRTLAIRNLEAKIYSDRIQIGNIECYYFNSSLLSYEDLDLPELYLATLDEDDIKWYRDEGIYDEEGYDQYSGENFLSEGAYEDFLNDNELDNIDQHIKAKRDVLYISNLSVNKNFESDEIIESFKETLYLLFNYHSFIIMDKDGSIIYS